MNKVNLMSANLQFFAEPDDGGNGGKSTPLNDGGQENGGTNDTDSQGGKSDDDGKKYTDAEVDAIVQGKKAKWKSELAEKEAEAKKLAEMNANQKKDYELQQANEARKNSDTELARYKMRDQARSMATEVGVTLTDADLDHLVTTDATSTKANMDWLTGLKTRIEADVKKDYLSGKAPKAGGDSLNGKTGTYAERLAKQKIQRAASPYFKKD
ncbi:DUF4355 domain-containing protein [Levilactobacillus enshiensis]|uniref:DUF4355 domain-containing protein n=1 Tax=Levilactobacillus enshiensis TaxID=2590213 RepID=UPI00131BCD10|nr:DUF4355 domain-containing protein [Levilactobacillus enshiensis]